MGSHLILAYEVHPQALCNDRIAGSHASAFVGSHVTSLEPTIYSASFSYLQRSFSSIARVSRVSRDLLSRVHNGNEEEDEFVCNLHMGDNFTLASCPGDPSSMSIWLEIIPTALWTASRSCFSCSPAKGPRIHVARYQTAGEPADTQTEPIIISGPGGSQGQVINGVSRALLSHIHDILRLRVR